MTGSLLENTVNLFLQLNHIIVGKTHLENTWKKICQLINVRFVQTKMSEIRKNASRVLAIRQNIWKWIQHWFPSSKKRCLYILWLVWKNIPRGQGKKIKEHEKHLERKQNAREQKAKDKMRSLTDKNIQVINFDIQKVLVTPKRCLLQ